MLILLERITRHWFLFFIIFGGLCLLISGLVGQGLGLPYLFRDSGDLIDYAKAQNILVLMTSGPTFLTQLTATFLIGSIWFYAGLLDEKPGRERHYASILSNLIFLTPRVFAFSLLPLLAAYVSANDRYGAFSDNEEVRAVLGTVIGYGFIIVYVIAAHILAKFPKVTLLKAAFALSIITLGALAFLPKLIPVVALGWLLGCFVLVYVAIILMPEAFRPVAVVTLVLWLSFSNGAPFKYQFDGIVTVDGASYYDSENLVAFRPGSSTGFRNFSAADEEDNEKYNLIDPVQSLEAWKDRVERRKPKLVLITTSGGAYRAAFWTALVLDKLKAESARSGPLARLTDHIKLVTGASGGMVAGAYFVASRGPEGDSPVPIVTMLEDDIKRAQGGGINPNNLEKLSSVQFPIARDSLSSIAQQLVQDDITDMFLPFQQSTDRGRTLESHWGSIKKSFTDLRQGEVEGWRPSIILSPIMVETGQPLLISNLSLARIRRTLPKPIFFVLRAFPDVETEKSEQQVLERQAAQEQQDAIEFFRLFPNAQQQFNLSTAVRMSASFAYISPAVELPTSPPQRIVDAGYYDNYGVSMAIAYLRQRDVMDWVTKNTSGVMIIQIRAFPTLLDENERRRIRRDLSQQYRKFRQKTRSFNQDLSQDEELRNLCKLFRPVHTSDPSSGNWFSQFGTRLGRSFQWLTSPLEGIETSRQTSMLVRNNLEIELLQDLYKEKNNGKDFLETVVFENRLSTSLNWNMPQREFECLQLQLTASQNRKALNQLAKFWQGRSF